jgi:outer membrane protein TolC
MVITNLKRIGLSLLIIAGGLAGRAQTKVVTLQQIISNTEKNYPIVKQKELQKEAGRQNQQVLDASLYPQVNLVGKATYQSEVTSFDIPGFPKGIGQKADNYDVGLEMRFPFTQFGVVKTQKQMQAAQTQLSFAQVDVNLQQLHERATNLVGNLLLQKGNLEILQLRITDLDSQVRKVAVGVRNGAILKMNQLELESEILSTRQNVDNTRGTLNGMVRQLAILTGMTLNIETQFVINNLPTASEKMARPELKTFEAQQSILELRSSVLKKDSRPSIYAFGQGYYGRPGYNFLNPNARLYGTAGIGLTLSLNNLLTLSKQQKLLDIDKGIIKSEEAAFLQNLQVALADKAAEIEKYEDMITKDNQIAQNRKEILRVSASQLANGVITSTDYLQHLNAANTGQLNLTLHAVQLAIAKAQYNILLGY